LFDLPFQLFGATPIGRRKTQEAHRFKVPTICIANKVDTPKKEVEIKEKMFIIADDVTACINRKCD
jgi:hypothetical protein